MSGIDHIRELAIVYEVRDQYRQDGTLDNPYEADDICAEIWDKEARRIINEEELSP